MTVITSEIVIAQNCSLMSVHVGIKYSQSTDEHSNLLPRLYGIICLVRELLCFLVILRNCFTQPSLTVGLVLLLERKRRPLSFVHGLLRRI